MSALDGTITFTTPTARNILRIAANAKLKRRNHTKQKPPLGEIEYKCVSAIIYRVNKEGKLDISAELTDICGHSVSTADPAQLRYKEE